MEKLVLPLLVGVLYVPTDAVDVLVALCEYLTHVQLSHARKEVNSLG
jgi:hypothetical protein